MFGNIFLQNSMDDKVWLTQNEQKEYDYYPWENQEFDEKSWIRSILIISQIVYQNCMEKFLDNFLPSSSTSKNDGYTIKTNKTRTQSFPSQRDF